MWGSILKQALAQVSEVAKDQARNMTQSVATATEQIRRFAAVPSPADAPPDAGTPMAARATQAYRQIKGDFSSDKASLVPCMPVPKPPAELPERPAAP